MNRRTFFETAGAALAVSAMPELPAAEPTYEVVKASEIVIEMFCDGRWHRFKGGDPNLHGSWMPPIDEHIQLSISFNWMH